MPYPHITLDHIPGEHLRGVGLVTQAWAYLEGSLERICWLMLGLQSEASGQALTTHMTHRSQYDAALALVHDQFPDSEPEKKLRGLQNTLTACLAGKRNNIVHSRLHGLPEGTFRIVYKARGKIRKETERAELEEYESAAREIIAATNEVIDILNELIEMVRIRDGAVPPWCDRP